jgi:Tol biopolymer transport system component
MTKAWLLLLVTITSVDCGRINYDLLNADDDGGGIDSSTAIDAAPAPDAGPFMNVTPIASLNSGQTDVDPSVTADGLQLFFCSNRGGTFNIYVSVRAAPGDAWPAPSVVGGVSSLAIEQNPAISADGLTLYFTRNNDIFQATRSDPAEAFGTPTEITELNTGSQDTLGSITADELALTLFSNRAGSAGIDIYIATRPDLDSAWTVEDAPGEINTDRAEVDSFLSEDRLTLYFDSDRDGGLTDYNVYKASRASASDDFGTPVAVSELNINAANGDSWHTADGNRVYFASGPFLNLDLHEATR